MSVHTIEEISPTRRKFKITVPADDVKKSWDKVIKKVQESADIRGFRKGKAPLTLIKNVYAKDISEKVVTELINDNYRKVASESKLQIVSQPSVEPESQLKENVDFAFSATVDIYPEFEVKDYKGLELKLSAEYSPEAEQVAIDAEIEKRSKDIPQDDKYEATLATLKENVQKWQKQYFLDLREHHAHSQIVDHILLKNQFDVPDSFLESAIDEVIFNTEVIENNKDPKQVNFKDQTLRDNAREQALKHIKGALALTKVANQEKLTVTPEEVQKKMLTSGILHRLNPQQFREKYQNIFYEEQGRLHIAKAIAFILENASIVWEPVVKPTT